MKKVALYVRTSSGLQTEFREQQRRSQVAYVHSVLETDEFIVYEDVGSSFGSRSSFEKLNREMESGEIGHVVARDISRISRSLTGWVEFLSLRQSMAWRFM